MTSMFGNNPLLIASRGIIVDPSTISQPISLRYEVKNEWSVIEDDSMMTSAELNVGRRVVIESYATIILDVPPRMARGLVAEAFNEGEIKAVSVAMSAIDDNAGGKKKRGRRSRDEDEDEDDEDEEAVAAKKEAERLEQIESNIGQYAIDILVDRAIIEDDVLIPINKSQPYKQRAAASEKNAEALSNNLAKLRKFVTRRGEALDKLRGGTASEDLDDTVSDMIPDKSTRAIDDAGLKNYEEKLRGDVQVAEQGIRDVYTFFSDKIIDVYNSKAGPVVSGLFDSDQVTFSEHSISRSDIIQKLFREELISIDPTAKPTKKSS